MISVMEMEIRCNRSVAAIAFTATWRDGMAANEEHVKPLIASA
jgi:hypothetical protein